MADKNQFQLLRERRFAPLFWIQFLGAANDNIFKFAFTVLATYQAAQWGGMSPQSAGAIIGGIFILPFLLFSATFGQLADKYDKAQLIRFVKNLEIAIMLVIAAGFLWNIVSLLFIGVFLMGVHSALFGPVKYAYLPQHLESEELTGGNGLVEMGTFIAILLGTLLGGELVALGETGPTYIACVSLLLAVVGRIAAIFLPVSPAPAPKLRINWNPFSETWRNLKLANEKRAVFNSILGISWLWFFGSVFLTSFTGFSREILGGTESVVALLLTFFSVGIATGALLCERLSGHKVEIGLVPFGSIGMTIFAMDLYFASQGLAPVTTLVGIPDFLTLAGTWRILADLFLLAMFAGFYSVPLYALIQTRTEVSHRSRIIASNNILNALFMVVASLLLAGLFALGLTIPQVFLVTALLNAAVAIYIYTLVPEFLMRFICWLLIHSVYRLKKQGIHNIPEEGPALLICNHVSFVDALVIMAASPRPIRFVMEYRIFKVPILSFIFRSTKAIPIASAKESETLLQKAYDKIAKALEEGDLVAIFPEGRITDNGELYPFKKGFMRILERTPVPVIPMALRGLWGSFFSRRYGSAMTKPFRRGIFPRIALAIAPAWSPSEATPEKLQAKIDEIRGDWR